MENTTQNQIVLGEIKNRDAYFIDASGKLDGLSLDHFNSDIGMGKEKEVGLYNNNNGVISFVDKDKHVHVGFDTRESREALVSAGYLKGNINVPYSNDGAIKLEQKIMGVNHLNEVEGAEEYHKGYTETEKSLSILDSEMNIVIHYLERGEAKKTSFGAITNLYDIAKSEKDGEISHVAFDAKTEGIIKKLTEKYFDVAFCKQVTGSLKVNYFKKALAGMYILGLSEDPELLKTICDGFKPNYDELMHGKDTRGILLDELKKFRSDFGLIQNRDNYPKKAESLDNILNN